MPAGGTAEQSAVVGSTELLESVAELDELERRAIAHDDWTGLEEALERQKMLWKRLARLADEREDQATRIAAVAGLQRLYEVRARNHAMIERMTEQLRGKQVQVRQSDAAKGAYSEVRRQAS